MDRKYGFIIGIGLVVLMQALVLALIPPPPANQNMGMYDTLFLNVNESGYRNCHASGVPDTHHNLVATGRYGCTNCHPALPDGSGITLVRDLSLIHISEPTRLGMISYAVFCLKKKKRSTIGDYD